MALQRIPGIGPRRAATLMDYFGSAKAVLGASEQDICSIAGLSKSVQEPWRKEAIFRTVDQEWEYIGKNHIKVLSRDMPEYPYRLKQCIDAPLLLYQKGDANLNNDRQVAIVGTRRHTDYGQRLCTDLVNALAAVSGLTIISGLAHGIDTIAHKMALDCQVPTIAVLAHGLSSVYPSANKGLAKAIQQGGALLSEFPSDIKVERGNFPARNRIVAGLTDVVVVVESDIKGGALITATYAQAYNREVAAFPGRVYDAKSQGTHMLIKRNVAALIGTAEDLLALMNWEGTKKIEKQHSRQLLLELSLEEQRLMTVLSAKETIHSDELLLLCGMDSNRLAATLLSLEMQGLIVSLPGKRYRLN